MEKIIYIGNEKLTYNFKRKNVKNINLRINKNGEINISANKKVSIDFIESFIVLNSDFIFDGLKKINSKKEDTKEKEYMDNEEIEILGKKYKLLIIKKDIDKIELSDKNLIIQTYLHDNKEYKSKMVEKYLLELSLAVFSEIACIIYEDFKMHSKYFPKIRVKNMISRWGSLSYKTNGMSLNKKLIHMPIKCVKYVIIHEFVHYIVKSHSKAFYKHLDYYVKKHLNVTSYQDVDVIFKKYEKKYI